MAFFARLAELERAHVPFAVATVVGRRAPVSAHLGDRALILADGTMEGFVGGSCSRDLVRREALRAIREGYCILEFPVLWSNDPDTRFDPLRGSVTNLKELVRIRWALLRNAKVQSSPVVERGDTSLGG